MYALTLLAFFLTLFAGSPAFAKDYPDGTGTNVPGAAVICSDGPTSLSGPCGTSTRPLIVSPVPYASPVAPVRSSAAETGHVLKSSAGSLFSITVTTGAAAGYVMMHNSTTVPSAGAVTPLYCWTIPANGTLALSWPVPVSFTTGISASFSTTGCFTQTNSSTAFFSGQVN